jgi:hypothetical protein
MVEIPDIVETPNRVEIETSASKEILDTNEDEELFIRYDGSTPKKKKKSKK